MSDLRTVVKLDGDTLITGSVQDCTPFLENATKRRNEGIHGSSEMRHAASFPPVIVERYCNEQGIEFSEFMQNPAHIKRLLGDPAISGFRVWTGRV